MFDHEIKGVRWGISYLTTDSGIPTLSVSDVESVDLGRGNKLITHVLWVDSIEGK